VIRRWIGALVATGSQRREASAKSADLRENCANAA